MINFWLAVDLGMFAEARAIYHLEPLIKEAVINLRKNGRYLLKAKRDRQKKKPKLFAKKDANKD